MRLRAGCEPLTLPAWAGTAELAALHRPKRQPLYGPEVSWDRLRLRTLCQRLTPNTTRAAWSLNVRFERAMLLD